MRIELVEIPEKLRYTLAGAHRPDAFPAFLKHLDTISSNLRTREAALNHRRQQKLLRA